MIWCKGFPFWYLVTGVSGLRLEGIWGEDIIWKCRCRDGGLVPNGGKEKVNGCIMLEGGLDTHVEEPIP